MWIICKIQRGRADSIIICLEQYNINDFPVEISMKVLISSDKRFRIEERFIGNFSHNLIMPLTKSLRRNAPIKIEQITLI